MLRLMVLLLSLVANAIYADVIVSNATVRLLPPGVPNTAAYFTIHNNSDTSQTLVAVAADFATKAEIHNHIMVNDMMRMQRQLEVVIQAGESIQFSPGGLHIMLFGLKQTLVEGQSVILTLQTLQGGMIKFNADVAKPSVHKHH